jgi:hypothetical protein
MAYLHVPAHAASLRDPRHLHVPSTLHLRDLAALPPSLFLSSRPPQWQRPSSSLARASHAASSILVVLSALIPHLSSEPPPLSGAPTEGAWLRSVTFLSSVHWDGTVGASSLPHIGKESGVTSTVPYIIPQSTGYSGSPKEDVPQPRISAATAKLCSCVSLLNRGAHERSSVTILRFPRTSFFG